jgi:hypothetical protein
MQTDSLLSWLADHLVSLCSQAQLGIVCSGLALELWQIAPAQLDPSERIELLLEHLAQTSWYPTSRQEFCATKHSAKRRSDEVSLSWRHFRRGRHRNHALSRSNPFLAVRNSRPMSQPYKHSLMSLTDTWRGRCTLAAYALLADQLGGFAHLGCRLGRSRLLLELIRRLYPLVAPLSVGDGGWQKRYAQLLWWETEALRMTGQLDAALVTTERQWPFHRDMLPGLWLRQAQIHRLAGRLKLASALTAKAQALSPDLSQQAAAAAEQAMLALLSGDAPLCLLHLHLSRSLLREAGQPVDPWPLRLSLLQAQRALRIQDVTEARKWLQSCAERAEANA